MTEEGQQSHRRGRRRILKWIVGGMVLVPLLYFAGTLVYGWVDYTRTEQGRMAPAIRSAITNSADRTPQWSNDGRHIFINVENEIRLVSVLDGTSVTVPDDGDRRWRYSPQLSSTGRLAYYSVDPDDFRLRLRVTNEAGRRPDTEYEERGVIVLPGPMRWSPDGSRLAYSHAEETRRVVKLLTGDRLERSWSKGSHFNAADIVWSQDSSWLVIVDRQDRRPRREPNVFHAVDRDGRNEAIVVSSMEDLSVPGWSTDGKLYYAERALVDGVKHTVLRSVDPDGWNRENVVNLTRDLSIVQPEGTGLAADRRMAQDLGWVQRVLPSPAGSRMVIVAQRTIDDRVDQSTPTKVYLWDVGSPSLTELPVTGSSTSRSPTASWSPDGTRIAIYLFETPFLSVIDVRTTEHEILFDPLNRHHP